MSEEKFENEEDKDVQEVTENTAQVTDEGAAAEDGFSENSENGAPINAAVTANYGGNGAADAKKPSKAPIIAVIAIVAVLIIAAVTAVGVLFAKNSNKYNKMGYINISGRTLDEVAEASGKSLDEFKTEYGLPEDMKGNTEESAAYYMIPAEKMAEMNGITFDRLKEMLGLADNAEITGDMPWGEVEGSATLKSYVGEDNVEEFKKYYELGDDITADTLWSEIRNVVDQKALDERIAEENAEKDAETETAETPAADAQTAETPVATAETAETPAA